MVVCYIGLSASDCGDLECSANRRAMQYWKSGAGIRFIKVRQIKYESDMGVSLNHPSLVIFIRSNLEIEGSPS
jgi:hypothetical protein